MGGWKARIRRVGQTGRMEPEQMEDQSAVPAVVDGAVSGSLLAESGAAAGIAGALAAGVVGGLVTLWARRRHPKSG